MYKMSILDIDNIRFYLVCPHEPSEKNPINLVKYKNLYSIEISIGGNTVSSMTVDEFSKLCHTLSVTRLTFGMASGEFCSECVELLLPSVIPDLHSSHTTGTIGNALDRIIH